MILGIKWMYIILFDLTFFWQSGTLVHELKVAWKGKTNAYSAFTNKSLFIVRLHLHLRGELCEGTPVHPMPALSMCWYKSHSLSKGQEIACRTARNSWGNMVSSPQSTTFAQAAKQSLLLNKIGLLLHSQTLDPPQCSNLVCMLKVLNGLWGYWGLSG